MALEPGKQLGPYEITGKIGAGGMGEVYKAMDPRLGRAVAIKVLPEHLAADPMLKQRFEREAQAISAMSHPNICQLYDIGHEDGIDFLVMELIEGENLSERLAKGPLPIEEFFKYATQIVDALDKAHRQGIVHRDLKPGNIMLSRGAAKLLDFGLAKNEAAAAADATSLSKSPTMTHQLTQQGTILGTYQYMSPEQMEGQEADARSDLFALGCVLFEMATGRRAFEGQTQASVIGSIMHAQPPSVSSLQPMAPPALDQVVAACLAKDREDRWQTAHDVLLQLRWIEKGGSVVGVPAPVSARRRSRERLAWALFALAAIAAVVAVFGYVARAPQPAHPVRFQVAAEPGMTSMGAPKVSPDGRHLAFGAIDQAGKRMLWVRSLDALEARALPGTDGAGRPFWSPDSRFLAFFSGGKLRKVAISGTPPQTICDAPSGADGTWGAKDTIVFDGTAADPLRIVQASGGIAKTLIDATAVSEESLGWPVFLPDGLHYLFTSVGSGENRLFVGSTESDETPVELLATSSLVLFAPPRHLIYVRDDTLVAQPFDVESRKLKGEPLPLAEEVGASGIGLAHISTSNNGVLVYRAGDAATRRLVWVDRSGKVLEEIGEPSEYWETAISPTGDRVAIVIDDSATSAGDIWIRDLRRGVNSRFTFSPADDGDPVWSPDGRTILFSSNRDGKTGIYRKEASGVGTAELVYEAAGSLPNPHSISPDGSHLAFHMLSEGTGWDIWILELEGENAGQARPYIQTPFIEVRPVFSPDGRWVAYDSLESGRIEIYARQFEGAGGKWQVSTNGGSDSTWGPDGRELYYVGSDGKLMRIEIDTGTTFEVGLPEPLFDGLLLPAIRRNRYISDRGERFLMLRRMSGERTYPATVVLNWDVGLGD
jgi:Tol biopolymer transport system component/tRNA A-37 threonylcarbamoyl transferase component Bud32